MAAKRGLLAANAIAACDFAFQAALVAANPPAAKPAADITA
jgi:hypothetical protein